MKNPANKFRPLLLLLLLMLTVSAFTPGQAALAQTPNPAAVLPPTPLYPRATIVESNPAYRWSMVANAKSYTLEIYLGATKIYGKTYDSASVCPGTICSKRPAKSLNFNAYKWRVGALVAGTTQWSPFKTFIVSPDTYENCFASGKTGWVSLSGTWSTYEKMLVSNGIANKVSSAYYGVGQYGDFTYEAILKRVGSEESFMGVRMGTGKLGSNFAWYPGYLFGYRNDGKYAIFYMDPSGARKVIKDWTASAAIKKNGWNTLKVIAKGSNFQYFINNTSVHSFKDTRRTRGFIGFSFTRKATESQFLVDWMKVTVIAAQ